MDIFKIVGDLLGFILSFFLELTQNYGVAIILFTLFVKLIMLPFEIKRQKSMSGTIRLSKKRAELEKKYSKDRMKLNQEINKLYEREEASPFGGCLSMFLPLFILFGVTYAVGSPLTNTFHFPEETVKSAVEEVKNNPDIQNLQNSRYPQIEVFSAVKKKPEAFKMFSEEQISKINEYSEKFNFLGMDLLEVPKFNDFSSLLWIMPVLSFIATLFMTYFMQKMQSQTQPREMKGCMSVFTYSTSLLSLWVGFSYPVAVGMYWFANTIFMIVQFIFLNKFYSVEMVNARQEAGRIAFRLEEEANVKRL